MTATFLYVVLLAVTFFIKKNCRKRTVKPVFKHSFLSLFNFYIMKQPFAKMRYLLLSISALTIMAFTAVLSFGLQHTHILFGATAQAIMAEQVTQEVLKM